MSWSEELIEVVEGEEVIFDLCFVSFPVGEGAAFCDDFGFGFGFGETVTLNLGRVVGGG